MAHRRPGLVVALLLAAGVARAATQGPPVYTYTGTAPSGSCSGTRVLIDAGGTGTYYCNAGTWALITAGGGGAPTTVPYWTGAADGTLSAEHNLGALGTGLVINTAGTPSIYAGGTCTAPNFVRVISASGAVTCAAPTLSLSSVSNPTGDWTATFPTGTKALWTFTGSTDEAFTIHGDGAFTGVGDLVHIHKSGTGATAGADALHVEVTSDLNMTGLRVTMANATRDAINTNALVTAGGFVGPLTGAVTGNASTATALAADPTACGAGSYVTDISAAGVLTCSTPAGTYTLPAASTTLGGVKMAAACSAGQHVASIGAGGELGCTADAGGSYTLPAATSTVLGGVKGTGSALTCSGTDKATGFAADGTLQCAADQTGASSGPAGYKVTGSNVTNSTTTPTNITGLAWSLAANTEYDFRCDITHQGTATSGPRFGLNGPASPTLVNIRWYRSTSPTASTQSNDTAFSAAAQTAAIATSGNTTVMTSLVMGTIINGANAGTAQFTLTSSTNGQTVTVYRGSGCTVF